MRYLPYTILLSVLIGTNIRAQTPDGITYTPVIASDAVKITNLYNPSYLFNFSKEDKTNSPKKYAYIDEVTLFTDLQYLELTQNIDDETE